MALADKLTNVELYVLRYELVIAYATVAYLAFKFAKAQSFIFTVEPAEAYINDHSIGFLFMNSDLLMVTTLKRALIAAPYLA